MSSLIPITLDFDVETGQDGEQAEAWMCEDCEELFGQHRAECPICAAETAAFLAEAAAAPTVIFGGPR